VAEVKKIYAGSELAAVILDSPEEIHAVTDALTMLFGRFDNGTGAALLAEIKAPAPE
jgi:hypothetical protein